MASDIRRAPEASATVSAKRIMQVAKPDTAPRSVRWHGTSIAVRPLLTFQETGRFIDSVMHACFDGEHDTAMPEALDFAIRANAVLRYSNAELPDRIEDQYAILYGTDLYDTVRSQINTSQLDAIIRALELCVTRMA